MKTIYLDSSNAQAMDELRAQFVTLGTDRDRAIEALNAVISSNLEESTAGKSFSGQFFADEDGNHYEAVDFQILSSYRVGGDTYFSGNEFRINYSHYAREILEIAEESFAGVDVIS